MDKFVKKDIAYISAVANSRINSLITFDKLRRITEAPNFMGALKVVAETGFGGFSIENALDFEKAVFEEKQKLNTFIKEYAPSKVYLHFCLLKNDFDNANALVKENKLNIDFSKLEVNCGEYEIDKLRKVVLGKKEEVIEELAFAINEAKMVFDSGKYSGAIIDSIFIKQYYKALLRLCNIPLLKNHIISEIDLLNLSIALRVSLYSPNSYLATLNEQIISGGIIQNAVLEKIASGNYETVINDLPNDYKQFYKTALLKHKDRQPLSEFERLFDGKLISILKEKRFVLSGEEQFLLYYLYKKAEIKNVYIAVGCVKNGLTSQMALNLIRPCYQN